MPRLEVTSARFTEALFDLIAAVRDGDDELAENISETICRAYTQMAATIERDMAALTAPLN